MKPRYLPGWLAVALLAGTLSAGAQVELSCRLEHTNYLQHEPLLISLNIRNAGSRQLVLSGPGQNARLAFDIQHSSGHSAASTGIIEDAFPAPIALEPGQGCQLSLDIGQLYDVRATGQYILQARIDDNRSFYLGHKVFFDVLAGLEIQRMLSSPPDHPDLLIVFSLRKLMRSDGEHLFLRMESGDEEVCYGVLSLGRLIEMTPPILQSDAAGRIHVLHQSGPSQYVHTVVGADGTPLSRDNYTSQFPVRMTEGPHGELEIKATTPIPDLTRSLGVEKEPVGKTKAKKSKRE